MMTETFPPGALALLGLIVGWVTGAHIAELPDRWIPIDQPGLTTKELVRVSRSDGWIARTLNPILSVCWLVGGALVAMTQASLFPSFHGGFAFAFAVSLGSVLGLARGGFELLFAVGPEARVPIVSKLPDHFLHHPRLRYRGALRLPLCLAAIVLATLIGYRFTEVLSDLLVLTLLGYLLYCGPRHVRDGVSTLRKQLETGHLGASGKLLWSAGALVFVLFGLAHFAVATIIIYYLWVGF